MRAGIVLGTVLWCIFLASTTRAHDLERTGVTLTFARDGSFVLEVSNDPNWLRARMEPFHGDFIDRVVLWVDGREIRPASAEYVAPRSGDALATYRLRGRMSLDARVMQWYYGLVIDPYPLMIRRADGRTIADTVQGDAWSRPVDLAGQFVSPLQGWIERQGTVISIVLLFVTAGSARFKTYASRPAASPDRAQVQPAP
jgi:hypothetical protein